MKRKGEASLGLRHEGFNIFTKLIPLSAQELEKGVCSNEQDGNSAMGGFGHYFIAPWGLLGLFGT